MSEQPPSRLRWRCRRGMQELDVMLGRWLESGWVEADEPRREAFERLIECEDDRLWDWLTDRGEPPESMTAIVADIRARTFGPDGS